MPIQKCRLNINTDRQELEVRGTPMFPCGGYLSDIGSYVNGEIPWHWHEEIEVIVIQSGSAHVKLNGAEFILKEGEGAFINSNVLHSEQIVGNANCIEYSLVFDKSLISGTAESVFEQRYVRPLLNCSTLPGIPLYKNIGWQQEAIQYIREAYDAYKTEKFGYELMVREKLSHMWYLIVLNMPEILEQDNRDKSMDNLRIKTMMNYLHHHYNEAMDLQQIAAAVNISERECLRCFKKTIGMSPVQYLLKYRVSVSARLLRDTNMPITEICSQTGFESPSYFSKIFKRFMGFTPTMYRKSQKSKGECQTKTV